jgi:hypothetical protein
MIFAAQQRLARIVDIFQRNASNVSKKYVPEPTDRLNGATATVITSTSADINSTDVEDIVPGLRDLSNSLLYVVQAIQKFPEFDSSHLVHAARVFEEQIRYWRWTLTPYASQGLLNEPAVQLYINDLSIHLGEALSEMGNVLEQFVDLGGYYAYVIYWMIYI